LSRQSNLSYEHHYDSDKKPETKPQPSGGQQPGFIAQLKSVLKEDAQMREETIQRHDALDRPHLSLDRAAKFRERKKLVTAQHNKELYLKNYGINLTIPSLYVQMSKFWKQDPSFVMKTEYYVQPDDAATKVYTYELNGHRDETTFHDRMVA